MDSNIVNVTRGLVRAILQLTEEQRRSANVQSVCQYIYCKFSINDQDDTNNTCHITSERLLLPDESLNQANLTLIHIAKYISLYIYPLFIFMGIFGNSLSCFIMFINVRRNGYSANLYLTLLAFVDCLFLLGSAFPDWIAHIYFNMDLKLFSDLSCRFVYWFGNFITHLSAGLVISVTVERFIAIQYPLIAHKIITVKHTHIVLIILISFFFLLDSRVLILVKHFNESIHIVLTCNNDSYLKYERHDILHCGTTNELNELTWVFMDFAVYTLIPFLIIVTLNSLIIHRLIHAQRLRQSMSYRNTQSIRYHQDSLHSNGSELTIENYQRLKRSRSVPSKASVTKPLLQHSISSRGKRSSSIYQSNLPIDSSLERQIRSHSHPHYYQSSIIRQRSHTNNIRLTVLLLFISCSFLALTLPAVVLNLILSTKYENRSFILKTSLNTINQHSNSDTIFYYTMARLLMIINHSINFILYFVVGKRFRRDLKILFYGYRRNLWRQQH